ncbi:thymidine phosphorylase [Kocuria palustris]|uniref:thymidine phosphorylase n=1 Tax=Kocuria palustris TaxID=71999 RepID=UPI0011A89C7A|nr:thymidine phosphorylase [Kocuria palustris]
MSRHHQDSERPGREPFAAVDIIRAKRDGQRLDDERIRWAVDAYVRGALTGEQMAALAMAVWFRGMDREETSAWTEAMIASGRRMDFTSLRRDGRALPAVDKHSTGGVGDKTTLPLAPLVAAHGVAVPQLSGRGLGHTGGTLDKLEAIPGWRAELEHEVLVRQLEEVGAVICAAGGDLAPADRSLYALRDVTATVDSVPLIASSIMSKKIAEGAGALVLDVKVGSGAFMKDRAAAEELARTMVGLGRDHGLPTSAVLTDMSVPLGRAVGNACEVRESVEVLAGGGPDDLVQLVLELARRMLALAGVDDDPADALQDGRAMDVWRRMIAAQGGDPDAELPRARHEHQVLARGSGTVVGLDALGIGTASWSLGAGRERSQDPVQAGAGVLLHAKPGETVREGQPLATLMTETPEALERAEELVTGAFALGEGSGIASPAADVVLGAVEFGDL